MTKHFTTRFLPFLGILVLALAFCDVGCKKKAPKEAPPPPAAAAGGRSDAAAGCRIRPARPRANSRRRWTPTAPASRPCILIMTAVDIRADQRDRVTTNAEIFRRWTVWQVSVEGHCDERGTNEYNLALGERRATSAQAGAGSGGRGCRPDQHRQLRRRAAGESGP